MGKTLTESNLDRQNILNNELAIEKIKDSANIKGILFEGKITFTKDMIAMFYDVDVRTIERYVSKFSDELKNNGYTIIKGSKLKAFREALDKNFGTDIDVGTKTTILGIFDFKAFLNIGMLLVESEEARVLRQSILNIVIDVINKKTGGQTKYINHRDQNFISSYLRGENYRREFTDALKDYIDMNDFKYALYTDKIYKSIFKERAKEYKAVLKLKNRDSVRDTLYSEILDLIASYECGLAKLIKVRYEELGRKLSNWELDEVFQEFESLPHWEPLIISGRSKMASRDLALREAFHRQLKRYIEPLSTEEYDKFLGDKGDEIEKLMKENADILKRLKDRG